MWPKYTAAAMNTFWQIKEKRNPLYNYDMDRFGKNILFKKRLNMAEEAAGKQKKNS